MKHLKLKFFSKNREAIKHFCLHFFERTQKKRNFKILKKNENSFKNLKKITLLKSPHVYKVAQEQFEYKIFKTNFDIFVTNYKKFLFFFKKIKTNRFFDVKPQLTLKIQRLRKNYLNLLFLNNFILNNFFANFNRDNNIFLITNKHNAKKKINEFFDKKSKTSEKFLKILDVFGEKKVIFAKPK